MKSARSSLLFTTLVNVIQEKRRLQKNQESGQRVPASQSHVQAPPIFTSETVSLPTPV